VGIRDRINQLGRSAAEAALTQAQAAVDRYLPTEEAPPVEKSQSVGGEPDQYIRNDIEPTELNQKHYALLEEEEIAKAVQSSLPDLDPDGDPKSLFHDPYALVDQMGFREKPTAITYGTLKSITYKMPVIEAIITTRLNQMAAFCNPQQDQYTMGFQVRLRDQKARPSKRVQSQLEQLELRMMQCGNDYDIDRDNFETFTRKIMWDSLCYDQANWEVVPSRKGLPAEWYAVDASTVRLADVPMKRRIYEGDPQAGEDRPKSVQIYDNSVITEYTSEEMAFCVRNPRTDIRTYGYGVSELERLISTVTSLLWAWSYNQNAFSQGTLQKGLLNLKGTINQKQMRAFRRHWYTALASASNAWRTPILNATEGVEWVKMMDNNKDMEFSQWMDFLIRVATSMYSMDAMEVGFQYGANQKSRPMFESNNKARLTESRDKGLKPLLRSYQTWLNRYLIWPIEEDFEFCFLGLNAATKEELAKLNKERVSTVFTVNEIRKEQDLDEVEGGDVILNPVFMQGLQMKQQEAMMAQGGGMGEEGGDFGAEEAEGAPDEQGQPDEGDEDEGGFLEALNNLDDEAKKSLNEAVLMEFAV
jgi:hypothetical protein